MIGVVVGATIVSAEIMVDSREDMSGSDEV